MCDTSENKHSEVEFWDTDDAELLSYTDIDEAVEMILDGGDWEILPKEIEITGYKRAEVRIDLESEAEGICEHILDRLDNDHEFGGEEPITSIDDIKDHAVHFLKEVVKEYTPWRCERACTIKIDAVKWVKENAPCWLEDNPSLFGMGGKNRKEQKRYR